MRKIISNSKIFLARNLTIAYWFYNFLGLKIFIGLILAMIAGILDGLGIAMFIPLLGAITDRKDSEAGINENYLPEIFSLSGIQLTFNIILLVMMSFFLCKAVIRYFNLLYRFNLLKTLLLTLRKEILIYLKTFPFIEYLKLDKGKIQNVLTTDVDRLQYTYTYYFQTIEYGVISLVYILFAYSIDFYFALMVTLGGLFINFFFKVLYKYTSQRSVQLSIQNNQYFGKILQFLANIKYIKVSGMYDKFYGNISLSIGALEKTRRKINLLNSTLDVLREPAMILIICISLWIQMNLFKSSSQGVIVSLLFFYRALTSVSLMQTAWNNFNAVKGSLDNINQLRKELQLNINITRNGSIQDIKLMSLELNDITYNIGEKRILKNIDLKLTKGNIYMVVGESGSGKSSLLNIMSRLFDDFQGEITISNEINMKDYHKESYQQRIGYLTQESIVFEGNVFDNVSLWDERNPTTEKNVMDCLIKANFSKELKENSKEDGILNRNISTFSGGQKQRINIARELYKNIDILIFDEGTSALDPNNEKIIMQNLSDLKSDLIVIVVTHNQTNLKFSDKVIYMDNGSVIDFGDFESLSYKYNFFK